MGGNGLKRALCFFDGTCEHGSSLIFGPLSSYIIFDYCCHFHLSVSAGICHFCVITFTLFTSTIMVQYALPCTLDDEGTFSVCL